MAKILLVVYDLGHSTTSNTRNALTHTGEHTVTTVADSNLGSVTIGEHDVIVTCRTKFNSTSANTVKGWFGLGVPLIIGFNKDGTSLSQMVGITTSDYTGASTSFHTIKPTKPHEMYTNIGLDGVSDIRVYSNGHYSRPCTLSIPSSELATCVSINDGDSVLAMIGKNELNGFDQPTPANLIYCGFVYGSSGYSAIGQDLLCELVSQALIVNTVVTGVVTDTDGNFGVFELIANDRVTGVLSGTTVSDDVSGNYSLEVNRDVNYITCFHPTNDPISKVVDTTQSTVLDFDFSATGGGDPEPPTFTAIVTGNVKKLGVPWSGEVVAVSVNSPKVVGSAYTNPTTGDYSIDVAPHTGEVLVYVAPDYGVEFTPDQAIITDTIIHPTVPNGYVYKAQNDGVVGSVEPDWGDGEITSGSVTFTPEVLHRPLMNGYLKPVIEGDVITKPQTQPSKYLADLNEWGFTGGIRWDQGGEDLKVVSAYGDAEWLTTDQSWVAGEQPMIETTILIANNRSIIKLTEVLGSYDVAYVPLLGSREQVLQDFAYPNLFSVIEYDPDPLSEYQYYDNGGTYPWV